MFQQSVEDFLQQKKLNLKVRPTGHCKGTQRLLSFAGAREKWPQGINFNGPSNWLFCDTDFVYSRIPSADNVCLCEDGLN